jgi:hypothetical protein
MYDDLCFYLDHDTELYFSGMFKIAVTDTIIMIICLILGSLSIFSGTNYPMGILLIGIAFLAVINFGMVKMYLHIRKDAIEIKEMLKEIKQDVKI